MIGLGSVRELIYVIVLAVQPLCTSPSPNYQQVIRRGELALGEMGNVSRAIGGQGNSAGSFRGEQCEERVSGKMRASPEPESSRMSIASVHEQTPRLMPVMIIWSDGGRQVSVTGSWDSWARIEPMHRSGEDFVLMKVLPSGLYHYCFIVDGNLTCDRDAPFSLDDPGGNAYNILDVKEFVAESYENIPEDARPDSPEAYGRNSIHDMDFSKPPPDLPPQMYKPFSNESPLPWTGFHELLARPQHAVLNHLYVRSYDSQVVALGSTCRFLEKYVTVILCKPSVRHR